MKFRKLFPLMIAVPLLFSACGGQGSSGGASPKPEGTGESKPEQTQTVKVGIAQLVEHPSLDAIREGFLAALKDNGYEDGKNMELDYQNAQNEPPNNLSIAQKMAGDKKDLILSIATSTSQAIVQQVKDTPVLFAGVSDPLGAKLISNMDKPGGNVSGSADYNPEAIVKLMDFIAAEFPDVKTVGSVVNEGEPNSVVMIDKAEEALKKHDIKLIRRAATNTSEVKQAAESLVGNADAIFIALDNTVVSAADAIIQVANDKKIPFFSSDRDTVEKGAIATYGFKYYDHGYQAGEMAVEILKNGANPGDMKVTLPDKLDLIINVEAAKNQGVEITDSMRNKVQDKNNILNDSK